MMAGWSGLQTGHSGPQGERMSQVNSKNKLITSKTVADSKLQVKSTTPGRKTEGQCQCALFHVSLENKEIINQRNKTSQLSFLETSAVYNLSQAPGKYC